MYLYRHKQLLMNVRDKAGALMLSFPTVIVMRLGGCDIASSADNSTLLIIGSAIVSVVAYMVHKKVSEKLKQFIEAVKSDPELIAKYNKDYEFGSHEDMVRGLHSEMTSAYMLAVDQAKRGNGYVAGYCYSRAKVAEAKLRRLG